jgi:hypothetical protein
MSEIPALKDEDAAHRVATVWRPTLCDIVRALVAKEYEVRGIPSVDAVDPRRAERIRKCIAQYGETLVEIPDDTWETSASQWMETHWDVLVDLWTAESGHSDLVLFVRVFEQDNGFRMEVDSVHVP